MASKAIFILFSYLLLSHLVHAYEQGELVPIYYNKIFSLKTQLAYTYSSLNFVCPSTVTSRKSEFLIFDQDFRGDRLVQSDFKINFLEDKQCQLLCKQNIDVESAIEIQDLIANDYFVEWNLDGMPGSTVSYTNEAPEYKYKVGFPLGYKKGQNVYINNHVIFQIVYTKDDSNTYNIVGFEVYPDSIAEGECAKNNIDYEHQLVTGRRTQISYTYSVQWKQVKNQPSKLWDSFLFKPNRERHIQSIVNAFVVVFLIFCSILLILYKTTQKDTSDDKDFKIYDETEDFVGWKLIHRDVFRRPIYGGLLTPIMGAGIQLILVALGLIVCLIMGWYHPAQPGSLTRWSTLLYLIGSLPGGYWSARIYKVFRGKSWILNSILTALVVPSVFISILFISTLITWSRHSSLAISFSGWVSLFSIWIFVLVPLTYIGSYLGEKVDRIEYPSRITQIPRLIPKKSWYQANSIRVILSGIIPFSIVFLDWNEFLISMTKGEYILSINYLVSILILTLICSCEITIVLIFLQLCSEDYHWWWPSFLIGSSPSLYMFGYGVWFLFKNTEIDGMVGGIIYTLNLLLGCSLFGLCTGTLGFVSSYLVIKKIYISVKRD